jgi:hypothetical protein
MTLVLAHEPVLSGVQSRQVAVHEAGHAIAACAVGFGMKKTGIILDGACGFAYTRRPGSRSQNPKNREFFNRADIVVALSGPIAEYKVNRNLVHIDNDVMATASCLRELLPGRRNFLPKNYGDHRWGDFWALIYVLATWTINKRETVLQELDEFPGLAKINMTVFEMLWPLAQEAHAVIDSRWSCVKKLSHRLLKVGSIGGDEIKAIIRDSS